MSRVQGSNLRTKREIRVASVFKQAPEAFLRMIVVHELAHLKEMNHGPRFWATVGAILPGYEAARSQLKDFPDDLTRS